MSGLPTPPMEDQKSLHVRKTSTKQAKPFSRPSKRSNSSHEHGAVVVDGRHKRVWKACERCRMKKTKCDGESPCKRCKDDGLVCTAGSRKKTEFKQLPRGYAEVLENTQYALIATVQKLYTMIRNNESWELGDPEMNDRGQPVIHDIASKLGCIRPSPDLPYAFPEGAEDFVELQAQLQAARSETNSDDSGSRKASEDSNSSSSPALDRTERASSSESDHSTLSRDYAQMLWAQQQMTAAKAGTINPTANVKPTPLNFAQRVSMDDDSAAYSTRTSLDTSRSLPSPIYTDFQTESPTFRNTSPFSPWSAGDEFLTTPHILESAAQFIGQAQAQAQPYQTISRSSPMDNTAASFTTTTPVKLEPSLLKSIHFDSLNFAEGTIRPGMLDCNNTGYDISDQMDSIIFNSDYESQLGLAFKLEG